MVGFKDGLFLIDGRPRLVMSGEIHYFRLDPADWPDRLSRLKEAGLNTVATYVPWLLHEPEPGVFDFEGRTNPRLNIEGFAELCRENGLYLFLRPGPFVMAELVNDGIPGWLYERHPELVPKGFEGRPAATPTLDYLAPDFLTAAREWYRHVLPVAARRLYPTGPVIALQIDNEVGMLSWVDNSPDLTPFLMDSFAKWLVSRQERGESAESYPFSLVDPSVYQSRFPRPESPWDAAFFRDLAVYMRERHAAYLQTLAGWAREEGLGSIPFMVNIHGSDAGRALTYPIGVSQLMKCWEKDDNIISGSDVYFSGANIANFHDMYFANGITACTNSFGKPLCCAEFACGDANYGDDLMHRDPGSANDFRTRIFLACGNKLLNHYLFSGGQNHPLPGDVGNGLGLIATTGFRHGFAAPLGPDGRPNQTFGRMARVTRQAMAIEETLATSFIDHDSLAYAFIPSNYQTEYFYEKAQNRAKIHKNLCQTRAAAWDSTLRAFLLLGLKPFALDVESREIPDNLKTLVVSCSTYMEKDTQEKLARYAQNGGTLVLQGRLPLFDLLGQSCRILAEAIGVNATFYEEAGPGFFTPVLYEGSASETGLVGFNAAWRETVDLDREAEADPLLRAYVPDVGSGKKGGLCGFYKKVGAGAVLAIFCAAKCHVPFFKKLASLLPVHQSLSHNIGETDGPDIPGIGVFITATSNAKNERIIHAINLDDTTKSFRIFSNGKPLFASRPINLPASDALMLPFGICLPFGTLESSTLEILETGRTGVSFRKTEDFSEICVKTDKTPVKKPFFECENSKGVWIIKTDNRLLGEAVSINFE